MSKKLLVIKLTLILVLAYSIIGYSEEEVSYEESYDVLILSSYDPGYGWDEQIINELEKYILDIRGEEVYFVIEDLGIPGSERGYSTSLIESLSKKYSKDRFDAIYAIGNEAYEMFLEEVKNEDSSFYELPIIFSGVSNDRIKENKELENIHGIYQGNDTVRLIDLIEQLTPNTYCINIIAEESSYGDNVVKEMKERERRLGNNEPCINYIQSNEIDIIINKLSALPLHENNINIVVGEFKKSTLKTYNDPKDTIKRIKEVTNDAPTYSNDYVYLDSGIIGGCIDIPQDQAEIIGSIVIDIKNNYNTNIGANSIEPIAHKYLDYESIYKYNIDFSSINEEITVVNKEVYELLLPKWLKTITIICSVIAILIFIMYILYNVKQHEEKERKYKVAKEAIEREKLKTDFIANLSHELRTPINVILGVTQVLEKALKNDDFSKEYLVNRLENINRNSYRLLKISNNMIDITKAESGMLELSLENCNVVSVIEEIFDYTIPYAKIKGINMIFDSSTEEIISAIDIAQIQRAVLNLLSNAIKFTEDNGDILLSIENENGTITIKVIDNGIGIEDDDLEYIFQRFYQVDNLYTRKNEGAGIGLCFVKEVVEIHGGKIEVKSEPNYGSQFSLSIPEILLEEEVREDINLYNPKIVAVEMSDI